MENADKVIYFKKKIEIYEIYENRIKKRIDDLLIKINIVNINIKENKKLLLKDNKNFDACEEQIELARHNSVREAKKHSMAIVSNPKLNKDFIIEKHNNFFNRISKIDEEILYNRELMNNIDFDICTREKQINNLKQLKRKYKLLLKTYRKYLIELEYRIGFCHQEIKRSTNQLENFYLNSDSIENLQTKKESVKSL